jgi:DNA-binding response OmpR family regulator
MKVLYVEDREAMATVFEYSYPTLEITWVDTMEKARKLVENHNFDVILLDLNLSDSKGMDSVSAMVNRGAPVVVLTANISSDFKKQALKIGAADYIFKKSFLDINVQKHLEEAVEKHEKTKQRYSSFSFSDLDPVKQFISCPPFEVRSDRQRQTAMA